MVGSAADPAALALAGAARALGPLTEDADNERPGATAAISAANPALSAAAPAITQRRVDLMRRSAASRIDTARDRSTLEDLFFIVERANHRSVRAV